MAFFYVLRAVTHFDAVYGAGARSTKMIRLQELLQVFREGVPQVFAMLGKGLQSIVEAVDLLASASPAGPAPDFLDRTR